MSFANTLPWLGVCLVLAACSNDGNRCTADDDCALDAQCQAGTCVALLGEGEGEPAEGEVDVAEGEGDAAEGEGEGEQLLCSLGDGSLSAADVPIALGLPVRMLTVTDAAADVGVDVDGAMQNGTRSWDFTTTIPDEQPEAVEAVALGDQWFADREPLQDLPEFDNGLGAYVAALGDGVLGVLEKTNSAVVLHAVASEAVGRTFIVYDPPIVALSFPLSLGSSFSSTSSGSGTFENNPFYSSTDRYTSQVDGEGVMRTLAGDFDVFRLRVEQEVTVGFFTVSYIRYQWITPCLGTVVDVQSAEGEAVLLFTNASRVRRLDAP
jgi:hypothetical protein